MYMAVPVPMLRLAHRRVHPRLPRPELPALLRTPSAETALPSTPALFSLLEDEPCSVLPLPLLLPPLHLSSADGEEGGDSDSPPSLHVIVTMRGSADSNPPMR